MITMENKPAVLQIVPNMDSGGTEQTTLDIANALALEGWRSIVISGGGQMVAALERTGATHMRLPVASKNPLTVFLNAIRLIKLIRKHKVSIIHAHSRAPAWSSLVASRICKIPFVTTFHGAYKQKSWLKALYNSVMIRSDVTIANSNWTAELVKSRHGSSVKKIVIIYPGTDFTDFSDEAVTSGRRAELRRLWNVEEGQPIVLLMARLSALKGHKTLIEAIPQVLKLFPDLIFVMAGGDFGHASYRRELEKRIAALGINNNVRLPGFCDDPSAAYALADLALVTSHQPETFGRVAIEAQALHTPVIVVDTGAVSETVLAPPEVDENGRTGWKIPPKDPDAIAIAIQTVLSLEKSELNEILERARLHVESSFSNDRIFAESINIYKSLLHR